MSPLLATAVSVGILGAICTWFFLKLGTILLWAAFIAWACFFQSGGDNAALKSTMVSNAFGSLMGWSGAMMILNIPLGAVLTPEIWASVVVFITVVIYIMASQIRLLASVPGTTFGYAATFAFLLQTPGKFDPAVLSSFSLSNVILLVPPSMWIGALFGYASAQLASLLTTKAAVAHG